MRTLQEIKDTLSSHKNKLFNDYPIKSMAIFGSYSRKEQNNTSDIDILVEFSDRIGIRFIDLADDLETILGRNVDLVSNLNYS
ncbi:MAG: nucleotidyltransferase family protein [Prolixibacteraceae bacterium]|nr:nucleotidyltransferase family protein [Prolixibacteraceae bacterium]